MEAGGDVPVAGTSATTTAASVARGGAWHAAGVLLPQFNTILVSVTAARYLGPSLFGRQSFIAFVELSVVFMLTDSLYTALMRSVGEALGGGRGFALRRLLAWAWGVEALAALAGGGALAAAALFGAGHAASWALAGAACAFGILSAVPTAFLIGAQRWRDTSIMWLVLGFAGAAVTVVVLIAGGGITGMFAVEAVFSAANLVWVTVLVRRMLVAVSPTPGPVGDLKRKVSRYALASLPQAVLSLVVWRRSEFFFLGAFSTDAEIAVYSVAFAAVSALTRLPASLTFTLAPAFATLHGAGELERIRAGFARAARLLLLLTLPLAAFAFALGPLFLSLVYGHAFHRAGGVLIVLLVSMPIFPLFGLGSSLLTGLGEIRLMVITNATAAAVDIAVAAALVPSLGAVGAAAANAAAQFTYAAVILSFCARRIGRLRWDVASIRRAVLVAVGSGAAAFGTSVWICCTSGLIVGIAAGTVTLALLSWQLKVIAPEDAVWLQARLGQKLNGSLSAIVGRCARAEVAASV